jgi:hypothetical protein
MVKNETVIARRRNASQTKGEGKIMGLFYRVPEDLKQLETMIGSLALFFANRGTPQGLIDETAAEVAQEAARARSRLQSEGRYDEIRKLRKCVLKTWSVMDNRPYNRVFIPFIDRILPKST